MSRSKVKKGYFDMTSDFNESASYLALTVDWSSIPSSVLQKLFSESLISCRESAAYGSVQEKITQNMKSEKCRRRLQNHPIAVHVQHAEAR